MTLHPSQVDGWEQVLDGIQDLQLDVRFGEKSSPSNYDLKGERDPQALQETVAVGIEGELEGGVPDTVEFL